MSKPFAPVAPVAYLQALTANQIVDLVAEGDFVGAVALKLALPRWVVETPCAQFLAEHIATSLERGEDHWAWWVFETQESPTLLAALERAGQGAFLAEQEAWKN